jgi:hypothetical protein
VVFGREKSRKQSFYGSELWLTWKKMKDGDVVVVDEEMYEEVVQMMLSSMQ